MMRATYKLNNRRGGELIGFASRQLTFLFSLIALLACVPTATMATSVVRSAAGANAAAIQSGVDQFRTDLGGGSTAGANGSFGGQRREINWDGVPDSFSAPNNLPNNFFNVNSPRGVVFSSTAIVGVLSNQQPFQVSATAASGTAINFGNLDASYTAAFQTFSAQRLFTALNSNIVDVEFFVPGTNIHATVKGFGAVFCDVDAGSTTIMEYFDIDGKSLGLFTVDVANNGLSFKGVSFNGTERVSRVRIYNGNLVARAANLDTGVAGDVVVMDDFLYSEPKARESHESDFDGDGKPEFGVFRQSSGTWFFLNSRNGAFSATQFGQAGDIPVEGDYDGDGLSDVAVFRPSVGTWFVLRSSTGAFQATQFGQAGDYPVPGDFDGDLKTDTAVWRPSDGTWYLLRSSTGAFQATQFGQAGDIPTSAAQLPY